MLLLGDLAHWRYEGDALTQADGDIGPDRVVERPKVLRRPDGRWVMLLHVDGPSKARRANTRTRA